MGAERRVERPGRGEAGFALILAILALMLLTFLGLTLAATSSTELQIASNYRWSQQAYYNAEAGLEAAKVLLGQEALLTGDWSNLLPVARPGTWTSMPPPPTAPMSASRNFYNQTCDSRGGTGYGVVLQSGGTVFEEVTTWGGQALNGTFTVWVRRQLSSSPTGYSDDTDNLTLVVTSEGTAPFRGVGAFQQTNRAVRVVEAVYSTLTGEGCPEGYGQKGGSQFGDNFNPCARAKGGAGGSFDGSLGATARGRFGGAGTLTRGAK